MDGKNVLHSVKRIGVLFAGTPDGMEIITLSASILRAFAFVPYGLQLLTKKSLYLKGDRYED